MNTPYILRTETTRIHAGKSLTRYFVYVVRDDDKECIGASLSVKHSQRLAAKEAKSYGCRIKVDRSAVGVQYDHQM